MFHRIYNTRRYSGRKKVEDFSRLRKDVKSDHDGKSFNSTGSVDVFCLSTVVIVPMIRYAIIIAVAIRLLVIGCSWEIGDVKIFHGVGDSVATTHQLYTSTVPHPYPPSQAIYEGVCVWTSMKTGIAFHYLIKILPLLTDMGILFLLWRVLGKSKFVLFYAFSPIAIWCVGTSAQFDCTAILWVILAYLAFNSVSSNRLALSALCLAGGILTKSFPVLLLPIFLLRLSTRNAIKYGIICMLPVIACVAPFMWLEWEGMCRCYIGHFGVPDFGWGGMARIVNALIQGEPTNACQLPPVLEKIIENSKFLYVLILPVMQMWMNRKGASILEQMIMTFLLFYVVLGGTGLPVFVWLLPILCLAQSRIVLPYLTWSTLAFAGWVMEQFYMPVLQPLGVVTNPMMVNVLYLAGVSLFYIYLVVCLVFNLRRIHASV